MCNALNNLTPLILLLLLYPRSGRAALHFTQLKQLPSEYKQLRKLHPSILTAHNNQVPRDLP